MKSATSARLLWLRMLMRHMLIVLGVMAAVVLSLLSLVRVFRP